MVRETLQGRGGVFFGVGCLDHHASGYIDAVLVVVDRCVGMVWEGMHTTFSPIDLVVQGPASVCVALGVVCRGRPSLGARMADRGWRCLIPLAVEGDDMHGRRRLVALPCAVSAPCIRGIRPWERVLSCKRTVVGRSRRYYPRVIVPSRGGGVKVNVRFWISCPRPMRSSPSLTPAPPFTQELRKGSNAIGRCHLLQRATVYLDRFPDAEVRASSLGCSRRATLECYQHRSPLPPSPVYQVVVILRVAERGPWCPSSDLAAVWVRESLPRGRNLCRDLRSDWGIIVRSSCCRLRRASLV